MKSKELSVDFHNAILWWGTDYEKGIKQILKLWVFQEHSDLNNCEREKVWNHQGTELSIQPNWEPYKKNLCQGGGQEPKGDSNRASEVLCRD